MSDNSPSTGKVEDLMFQVFENDMLREMILSRVIAVGPIDANLSTTVKPVLSSSEAIKCRLVCKSWMKTTSTIYRRIHQPLFHIRLTHVNTSELLVQNNSPQQVQTSPMHQFTSSLEHWGLEGQPRHCFTFNFELLPSFFKIANANVYAEVFNFLKKYGSLGMTNFSFIFFRNKFDYIPTALREFSFPKLKQVTILIERMALSFMPLIQRILRGAQNLEILNLTSSSCVITHSSSNLAEVVDQIASTPPYSLQLPSTMRQIFIFGTVDSCSCFYRIPVDNLPNLGTLTVSASSCISLQLNDILTSLAGTLINLNLIGFTSCVYAFNRQYLITLSSLSTLKSLTINSPWEIKPRSGFHFAKHLPCLKELKVVHCDPDMFHELLIHQRSETVEKCRIVLIQQHTHPNQDGFRSISPRMDSTPTPLIELVVRTFPNLSHLELSVTDRYTLALEHVFSNMSNLKGLTLFIEANSQYWSEIHWDSVFTGLSTKACQSMEGNRACWENVELIDSKFVSIRKLINLKSLYLVETSYPPCRALGVNDTLETSHSLCNFNEANLPMIPYSFSEMSFHFSFFKMPRLKTIAATKGLMPTESVQREWMKEKGTQIRTIKSPKLQHLIIDKFSVLD